MRCLLLEDLKELEKKIDSHLKGRDPYASNLEKPIQHLILNYGYEVDSYNRCFPNQPYINKYGMDPKLQDLVDYVYSTIQKNGMFSQSKKPDDKPHKIREYTNCFQ